MSLHKTIPCQSKASARVRKADEDDFDRVYPLLQQLGNGLSGREDWQNLFKNHWQLSDFSPGMILETDEKVVGFLSTIYSHQMVNGQKYVLCNLSSWIVDKEYRSQSILLLLPLIKNKNIILTSFSSNEVSYAVYNKLGFKDGNASQRIIYQFPSLANFSKSQEYQIITDPEVIQRSIIDTDRQIYNDHLVFQKQGCLIIYKDEYCLIMGQKNDQQLTVYTVSNRKFLQQHLKFFRHQLMKYLKVKQMVINENYLNNQALFMSRKVSWGIPCQYKTNHSEVIDPVPLYSELFLLKM